MNSGSRLVFKCILILVSFVAPFSSSLAQDKPLIAGQIYQCTESLNSMSPSSMSLSSVQKCPIHLRRAVAHLLFSVSKIELSVAKGGTTTHFEKKVRTSKSGKFSLRLAPGRYLVSPLCKGSCPPNVEFIKGFKFKIGTAPQQSVTIVMSADESAIACPPGYVSIDPNPDLGTERFCVAQFEMKQVDGVAQSVSEGIPWTQVTRNEAIIHCASLGSSYHLISNAEWQAVAREIESVDSNWSSGVRGIGSLNIGNFSDEFGAVNESNPCHTPGYHLRFPNCSTVFHPDFLRKRSHVLKSGQLVWDLGGNATEWVSTDVSQSVPGNFRGPPCALEGKYRNNFGPAGQYPRFCDQTNSDGFGCIEGEYGSVIFRGGSYTWESSPWRTCPGIFYANTNSYWDANTPGPGFRCAYR